jgi:hypothetical protein
MKIFKSITVFAFSVAFLFCFIVTPATAEDNGNNLPQIMQELSLDKTQALHQNEMSEIKGQFFFGFGHHVPHHTWHYWRTHPGQFVKKVGPSIAEQVGQNTNLPSPYGQKYNVY